MGRKTEERYCPCYVRSPEFFMFDEPTSALDNIPEVAVHETIDQIAKE